MSVDRVLEVANAEVGYTENPPGSNRTKYWSEYDPTWQGQPWCVAFLWWAFHTAGEGKAFFGGAKTASCSILYRWFKENGQDIPLQDIQAGDVVFFNFHGGQALEHVGLVERKINASGWYRTIEGNTSPGLEGSQDNGGCVAEKARHISVIVKAVRPVYTKEKTDYDGHWAEAEIRWGIKRGLIKGYADGTIKPDAGVTRAELMVILKRLEDGRK